ncbi:hypothetical protein A4A49_18817 [Nicotiana attenuata]|uniref:Uncharacterized protein n=1 Tax=Nicotiana attenuata TaxID=49451 RepID=A0A1J6IV54_NICAT|nr:hypothetical protein A4A49_18817 [Nicotiana attenuata]
MFENGILHVKQQKLITSTVKRQAIEAENTPVKRQKTSLRDEYTKQDNADNNLAKEPAKNKMHTSPKKLKILQKNRQQIKIVQVVLTVNLNMNQQMIRPEMLAVWLQNLRSQGKW